ncbi:DNA repair protein RadC 3 [Wolbachia endosymbiont of Drosophila simulans wNo]|uniref:RadC family protein n=1 Tax=unclassified Wolbachia TaxID=2640676 RepID=UPI0002D24D17|nr:MULTISPECIES: DNA repair protein RadC [unclassified Wolbachia]AGJ99423.1 DNA repair protein RadC 3 [Wolbachia endosymbiont of Drosophila simulans wNo]QCB62614.1 DNA repair protein RadC [Wolbachia endosymbiont of Drosophila mauritiana]QCB63660.1 DNA repair protein RadC [Wolbachia endosymbiont of Drosophila mauritiana]QWE33062.1 DNA repair protein RadC [Wolbachia endosymbiont of Drosophila simulans]TGB06962.1 DNA repair protein RadC [Wolbachia endosymbiont of Drosophila mauritiana]
MKDYKKGHRKRLRERIILDNGQSLLDYEILEHILYSAYSRIDVKPVAKNLIEIFGSLNKVFNADLEALQNIEGISNAAISAIFCVKQAFVRSAREEIKDLPIINNWENLLDYLKVSIGSLNKENFRVIYMNKRYRLIAEDLQNFGTVDQTPIYVREIIRRALLIGSTSIVISHNHPSGDIQPSSSDMFLTRQLAEACKSIGIELIDHIIITFSSYFSFKENRLLLE